MGYDVEYDDTGAEDCDFDRWVHRHNRSGVHGYGFSGNRASSSSPQPPARCHGATDAKVRSRLSSLAVLSMTSVVVVQLLFLNHRQEI